MPPVREMLGTMRQADYGASKGPESSSAGGQRTIRLTPEELSAATASGGEVCLAVYGTPDSGGIFQITRIEPMPEEQEQTEASPQEVMGAMR